MTQRLLMSALILVALVSTPIQGQERSDSITDEASLHKLDVRTPGELRAMFHYDGKPMLLLSAHRGGAGPGYPENCIETFEHTLRSTFSMFEVDPRMTKDGEIVIHHDATLDRTTTGTGKLVEKTLAELKQLKLRDSDGNVTPYTIPTLDEALAWAKGKTILVLDQKDVSVEKRVAKIQEHNAEPCAMLIVNTLADAKACYAANKNIMMEAMITDSKKFSDFDASGIPWENIIAFLGHSAPIDEKLFSAVHDKGSRCMVGTSRNFDRNFASRLAIDSPGLRKDYDDLLGRGVDVIETDIPRELAGLLSERIHVTSPPKR